MAWAITEDCFEPAESPHSRVGVGVGGTVEAPAYGWVAMDEDGETHYKGLFDDEAVRLENEDADDPGSLSSIWGWCMRDTGATEFKLRAHVATSLGFWNEDLTNKMGLGDGDLVSIFA